MPTAASIDVEGVPVQATEAPLAPSAPTPDPRVVNAQRLREAVFAPFRGVPGRFGIAVKDLATGQQVLLNEHFPFQSASLYKLPVMYEVFKLRDLDFFALDEELTIGPDDAAMDLGSLPWPIGTRITIGTALERMVSISDNSGAYMLTKKVSSARINEDMLALGLDRTHIRGEDIQTSAYDMARLLEVIARGQAVSPSTSAEMVHLMARQQVRNRIPLLLPADAIVANKTGNWEGAAHDVAIVYGPGSTVVIAFLSDGITDFDELYLAMATAAANVYNLVNDPAFESRADPALPRNEVASYAAPAKVPAGASTTSQARPTAPTTNGPATVPAPADKPRAAPAQAAPAQAAPGPTRTPAQIAPAAATPGTGGPAPGTGGPPPAMSGPALAPTPAIKPAEKPAQKPQQAAPAGAPAGTPAIKPQAPSIFAPAPTKTP